MLDCLLHLAVAYVHLWLCLGSRAPPPPQPIFTTAPRRLLHCPSTRSLSSTLLLACRLDYIPQQLWLEVWFSAAGPALPRCEPQQLTTMAAVLGNWGLVPVQGFSIDFWRAVKARCVCVYACACV